MAALRIVCAVCDILSSFMSTHDWRTAFLNVIPMRKADPEHIAAKLGKKRMRGGTNPATTAAGGTGDEASSSHSNDSNNSDSSGSDESNGGSDDAREAPTATAPSPA